MRNALLTALALVLILVIPGTIYGQQWYSSMEEALKDAPSLAKTSSPVRSLAKEGVAAGDTVGGWVVGMKDATVDAIEFSPIAYSGKSSLRIKYTVTEKGGFVTLTKTLDKEYAFPKYIGMMMTIKNVNLSLTPFFSALLDYKNTQEAFGLGAPDPAVKDEWQGVSVLPQNKNNTHSIQYFDKAEMRFGLADWESGATGQKGTAEILIDRLAVDSPPVTIDDFEGIAVAKPVFQIPSEVWDFGLVSLGDSGVAYLKGTNVGADTVRLSSITPSVSWLSVYPDTARILAPQDYGYWKVVYRPEKNMTAGPWPIIFRHNGDGSPDSAFATADITTGISSVDDGVVPGKYVLGQNYPNPFNPSTRIRIEVPKSGLVKLAVYNVLGQQVAVLVDRSLTAGSYEYELTAAETSRLASGVYFYRLETEGFTKTMRMVLVK